MIMIIYIHRHIQKIVGTGTIPIEQDSKLPSYRANDQIQLISVAITTTTTTTTTTTRGTILILSFKHKYSIYAICVHVFVHVYFQCIYEKS